MLRRGISRLLPAGPLAALCILLSAAPCLAFSTAGGGDVFSDFDFEEFNRENYENYHRQKTEAFRRHGALNPDGSVNKAAGGYDTAAKEAARHHDEMMQRARTIGQVRDRVVRDQLGPAGEGLRTTGTDPSKAGGRGSFGDFEGTLKPTDYDKAWKNVEGKPGWKRGPDYIVNERTGAVIHRGPGVGDIPGSSAADARINAQAGSQAGETMGSAGSQAKYQGTGGAASRGDKLGEGLDAARKGEEALTHQPRNPYEAYKQNQQIAKAGNLMNEAAGLPPDPKLAAIKQGADPDLIKDIGNVKDTARGQMQNAWKEVKAADAKNLSSLEQRITEAQAAGNKTEAAALRAERNNIIARQGKTLETLTAKDGGKALTQMTGETPAAIKSEIGSTRAPRGGGSAGAGSAADDIAGAGGARPPAGGGGTGALSKLGPLAKWGLMIYGIYSSGSNIINHKEGIVEGAKEESGGWLGGFAGGLVTGGPVGAVVGTIAGILATNKGFADWLFGNDKEAQDLKAILELQGKTSPKAFEKGLAELTKSGGLTDLLTPPPGLGDGTADISKTPAGDAPADAKKSPESPVPPEKAGQEPRPPETGLAGGTPAIGGLHTSADLRDKEVPATPDEQAQAAAGLATANIGQTYADRKKDKKDKETKQKQDTDDLRITERETQSQTKDQQKKVKIAGQGLDEEAAIGKQGQEFEGAQAGADITRTTSIGSVIASGIFGGLTSGVAVGLDNFFGTIGSAAGEKASQNLGLVPKPKTDPASAAGEESADSGDEEEGPGQSASASGTPAGPGGSGGGSKNEKGSKNKPGNKRGSQGAGPDCSQYRRQAQALTARYQAEAIPTAAYKSQMQTLRAKYKGCGAAPPASKPTPAAGTPPQGTGGGKYRQCMPGETTTTNLPADAFCAAYEMCIRDGKVVRGRCSAWKNDAPGFAGFGDPPPQCPPGALLMENMTLEESFRCECREPCFSGGSEHNICIPQCP